MLTPHFFEDHRPEVGNFLDDTLNGLSADPKSLHPKYLYDARGAKLFEKICSTEEYYITRTEISLLHKIGDELADLAGDKVQLVEFGMGDGEKARMILSMFESPYGFVGIDISREQLHEQIQKIAQDFPHLKVGGICADFFKLTQVPQDDQSLRSVGFFPGSTIGNFMPAEQKKLLNAMRRTLGDQGSLIIGVDLKKDAQIIHAAYDDQDGITAAFSLNLLRRINRELDGDIDLQGFKHEAVYNEQESCIEICLRSLRDQTIKVGLREFPILKDEPIHTEKSYKFTPQQFSALAQETCWKSKKMWTDKDQLFSIHWLDAA